MKDNWRVSLFSVKGRWCGFALFNTEEETRRALPHLRLPGDRAVVAEWDAELKDYRDRFTVTDEGEETPESWAARLDARCQAAARQRDHVGAAKDEETA